MACMCYCLHQYLLDEDVSRIDFALLNENEHNIYPTISFCIDKPFLEEDLKVYGINVSSYTDFLLGNVWDDKIAKIDYSKITIKLENHIFAISGLTNSWKSYHFYPSKQSSRGNWQPTFYEINIAYVTMVYKCLSFEVPYIPKETIRTLSVYMNSSIFPNGIRPTRPYTLCVYYHYPHQSLRTTTKTCNLVQNDTRLDNYSMFFRVQMVVALRQRNKRSHRCVEDRKNDDNYILSSIVKDIGCKPLHWKIDTSFPNCSRKEIMKMIGEYTPHYYTNYPNPPCQRIKKILANYEEYDMVDDPEKGNGEEYIEMRGIFEVKMKFEDETFLLIQQTRDFDIQSLVGNSGGYLGLFLGCAILQIPQGIKNVIDWAKNVKNTKNTVYVENRDDE